MTFKELDSLIEKAGFQTTYGSFEKPPPLPYVVYRLNGSNNFAADDNVYAKINEISVELYTTKKHTSAEERLETVFDEADVFYNKTEIKLSNQKMYQTTYEMEELG